MNRLARSVLALPAVAGAFAGPAPSQVRLDADRTEVATPAGAGQVIWLDAGTRHARSPYLFLGSLTGTRTGVRLGPVHVPVEPDAYTMALLGAPDRWLLGSAGLLDGRGRARARLRFPPALDVRLFGVELHHAALVLDPSGAPAAASNAVPLRIGMAGPQADQLLLYGTRAGGPWLTIDDQGFIYTGPRKVDPSKQGDASIVWTEPIADEFFNTGGVAWGRDASGNPHVYACGWTSDKNLGTSQSFDPTHGGGRDGAVVMLDPANGARQNATYLSGTDDGADRYPQTVRVRDGWLYVVGSVGSGGLWYEDPIDTTGGTAWCMRFAGDLSSLDWSTQLPAVPGAVQHGYDIEVDASGNVYVAGFTESDNQADLDASGYAIGHDGTHNGKRDGFLLKLSQEPDGKGTGTMKPVAAVYTYFGGSGDDEIHDISLAGGKVYVAGRTESKDLPVTTQKRLNGRMDAFFARFDADTLQREFADYFGGKRSEGDPGNRFILRTRSIGIVVADDRLHLTGITDSEDLPTTPGAIDADHDSAPSKHDVFVARFADAAATPTLTELTYLGGDGEERTMSSCWVDTSGNLYLGFSSDSSDATLELTSTVSSPSGIACKVHYDDPPETPPGAPTGLSAGGVSCSAIDLSWTDADSLEDGFAIERSPAGANTWAEIDRVGADVTTYRDSGLAPSTGYDYRVFAFNTFGSSSPSNVATGTTLSSPPLGDHVADGETAVDGTVTGTFQDTQGSDDVYQSIEEEAKTKGNPKNRGSFLEHRWTIPLPCGASALTFRVEAHRDDTGEGDAFVFDWSTDGQTWSPMTGLAVTKTADDDQAQSFVLPSTLTGTLHVRVRDADRTAGNSARDTVHIDRLWVHSDA